VVVVVVVSLFLYCVCNRRPSLFYASSFVVVDVPKPAAAPPVAAVTSPAAAPGPGPDLFNDAFGAPNPVGVFGAPPMAMVREKTAVDSWFPNDERRCALSRIPLSLFPCPLSVFSLCLDSKALRLARYPILRMPSETPLGIPLPDCNSCNT